MCPPNFSDESTTDNRRLKHGHRNRKYSKRMTGVIDIDYDGNFGKSGIFICRVRYMLSSVRHVRLSVWLSVTRVHQSTRQHSYRKEDRAMRPIGFMGALKSFESPHYAPGYCSRNF